MTRLLANFLPKQAAVLPGNEIVNFSKRLKIGIVLSVLYPFFLITFAGGLFAQQFYGYDCTEDCSGHEAGYAWAERNDVTDPDDCGGNSNSFIEGCIAYAEEYQEAYGDEEEYTEDGEPCEDYPKECEDDR